MLGDPAVLANRQQMQKLSKEHSDIRELIETLRLYRDVDQRVDRGARDAEGSGDARSGAPGGDRARRRAGAAGEDAQRAADAQGSQRRQEHHPRDPRRHGRRGGGAVRGRSVPHVHALRRAPPLGGRDPVDVERVGGRDQGSHGGRHGQGRLRAAQVRIGRAPRAARARHRGAGAHPHVDRDRRGDARGRGRRDQHRPQGPEDRRHALGRAGRPVGQHDRLGGAHPPHPERPHRPLPAGEVAAQEQGDGDEAAAREALRHRGREAPDRRARRAPQPDRIGRSLREDPHLQLPAGSPDRSPHRADAAQPARHPGRRPRSTSSAACARTSRPKRSSRRSRERAPPCASSSSTASRPIRGTTRCGPSCARSASWSSTRAAPTATSSRVRPARSRR